jgi:DNA repair photolyase
MSMQIQETTVKNILTRASGFLRNDGGEFAVCSHTVNPYQGCTYGNSLCGVGCYMKANGFVTRGRDWGTFLEIRKNASESYSANYESEKRWAHKNCGRFGIFCSSATDPFLPQERTYHITQSILKAMIDSPPDALILQTHSGFVTDYVDIYQQLAKKCELRFHISIETDRDRLPGLPAPASSIQQRLEACERLTQSGFRVVVIVAPLLPIANPQAFFGRISNVASALVIDHFIHGDGSPDGRITKKTALPIAMAQVEPRSVSLAYREEIVQIARTIMPGRVGISADGFAGIYD